MKIQIPKKKKSYFSCFKQYVYVYLQRQEDNLSTILLNRHYKAMPEAKRRQIQTRLEKSKGADAEKLILKSRQKTIEI